MKNELIEIPDYNPNLVLYITKVVQYINKIPRIPDTKPIIIKSRVRDHEKEQYKYWAKFIFKTLHEDPLGPLWKIQKKYPNLLYERFISEKVERFTPPLPSWGIEELYYIVYYLELKDSLVTYLKSKVNSKDIKLVNQLQELFGKPSKDLDWDKFIEMKAKFLTELDLSNFVKEMNLQTKKKRVARLGKI